MALHGKTPGKIRDAVLGLKPFKIGNVSGSCDFNGYGRLPAEYAAELQEANREGRLKYVLYSYGTPMAWLVEGPNGEVWAQPQVKYSVSTSGHQSVFASAIRERA